MKNLNQEAIKVHNALLIYGLENPIFLNEIDIQKQKEYIAKYFLKIIKILNLNNTDSNLIDTPKKVAEMYVEDVFSGLNYINFPNVSVIKNKFKINDAITIKNIMFASTCEHHLIVMDCNISVAYIPDRYIIGLSKINSIVRFFAKRPQIQERLTKQISLALQTLLETSNVAVSIEAKHYCVKARGIKDQNSTTITYSLNGLFKSDKNVRKEFFCVKK